MPQRLPTPGGDSGVWDTILNGFLGVVLNSDGTLNTTAVEAALIGVYLGATATVGGDLSGTMPNPTVAKVDGVAVSGTAPQGYVLTATGPSTAAWQINDVGVFPVKDFGTGVGTGSTSVDTAALTAANAAMIAAGGGIIWWDPGSYQISDFPTYVSANTGDLKYAFQGAGSGLVTIHSYAVDPTTSLMITANPSSASIWGGAGHYGRAEIPWGGFTIDGTNTGGATTTVAAGSPITALGAPAGTSVNSSSNGLTLTGTGQTIATNSTVNLTSQGFHGSGTLTVVQSGVAQTVTYTGTSTTSFTGCTGSITLGTNQQIWQQNGAAVVLTAMVQSSWTCNATSTTGFAASGALVINMSTGNNMVYYTSLDSTHFYGCTGGAGTLTTGNTIGQAASGIIWGDAFGGHWRDLIISNFGVNAYSYTWWFNNQTWWTERSVMEPSCEVTSTNVTPSVGDLFHFSVQPMSREFGPGGAEEAGNSFDYNTFAAFINVYPGANVWVCDCPPGGSLAWYGSKIELKGNCVAGASNSGSIFVLNNGVTGGAGGDISMMCEFDVALERDTGTGSVGHTGITFNSGTFIGFGRLFLPFLGSTTYPTTLGQFQFDGILNLPGVTSATNSFAAYRMRIAPHRSMPSGSTAFSPNATANPGTPAAYPSAAAIASGTPYQNQLWNDVEVYVQYTGAGAGTLSWGLGGTSANATSNSVEVATTASGVIGTFRFTHPASTYAVLTMAGSVAPTITLVTPYVTA